MKKYDAVIAGYFCLDMVPVFQKNQKEISTSGILKPGSLIEIDGLGFSAGGVVANTGAAMKKFGRKVYLNGLIGEDLLGKIARDWFEKLNLSEGIQVTNRAGTAFSIVLAPPGIDRIFLESPGCNKIFGIRFIDFEAASQSRLFHFGYPPLLRQFYLHNGDELQSMFSGIQQMGVVTSMDFSLPDRQSESGKQNWLHIMERVLPYTDIFVPSLEEVLQIMVPDQYEKILSAAGSSDVVDQVPISLIRETGEKIIDYGVKILVIKAAHRGIYLLTGDISPLNKERGLDLSGSDWSYRELWCSAYPADPAKVKNATGAGDTAIAAFLTAILDGNTAEHALKYAAIAGRNNLYCHDIYEELDDWQSMEKEVKIMSGGICHFK